MATTTTTTSGGISGGISAASPPTVRFLTHLTLPENPPDLNKTTTTNGFELHESDVVWSSSSEPSETPSPSPSNASTSPPIHRHNSGLYAALSDDHRPLVRRKPAMSPSQSAATAARTIPPVALRRSSEAYSGYPQSAPVNVPVWPEDKRRNYLGQFDDIAGEETEDEDDGDMIPPHEIVARSYVTFSVFEGAGRTLKGRDLCRVRNSVFQQTGLLD